MAAYSFNAKSSIHDPFVDGFNRGGSVGSQSLVLDSQRGELVKAPVRAVKKGASEAKTIAALKSHSEAERRRRERINSHLDTLRGLVPSNAKVIFSSILFIFHYQLKLIDSVD